MLRLLAYTEQTALSNAVQLQLCHRPTTRYGSVANATVTRRRSTCSSARRTRRPATTTRGTAWRPRMAPGNNYFASVGSSHGVRRQRRPSGPPNGVFLYVGTTGAVLSASATSPTARPTPSPSASGRSARASWPVDAHLRHRLALVVARRQAEQWDADHAQPDARQGLPDVAGALRRHVRARHPSSRYVHSVYARPDVAAGLPRYTMGTPSSAQPAVPALHLGRDGSVSVRRCTACSATIPAAQHPDVRRLGPVPQGQHRSGLMWALGSRTRAR